MAEPFKTRCCIQPEERDHDGEHREEDRGGTERLSLSEEMLASARNRTAEP